MEGGELLHPAERAVQAGAQGPPRRRRLNPSPADLAAQTGQRSPSALPGPEDAAKRLAVPEDV